MDSLAQVIIPSATADAPLSVVHSLPINTEFNGQSQIKSFFLQSKDSNGNSTAYFRGRELKGKSVSLPAGLTGVVLRKDSSSFVSADVFNEITLWEHDVPPDVSENRLNELLEFTEIANCLHVDDENDS